MKLLSSQAKETFESAIALSEERQRVPTLMTTQEIRSELSEVQNNYAVTLTRKTNHLAAKSCLIAPFRMIHRMPPAHNTLGNGPRSPWRQKRALYAAMKRAHAIDPNMAMAQKNLATITPRKSKLAS